MLLSAGYIEPVLLVLHEKDPTWAGRAAVKKHTCMVTALSINTTMKQHPLIWSASVCLQTSTPFSVFLGIWHMQLVIVASLPGRIFLMMHT